MLNSDKKVTIELKNKTGFTNPIECDKNGNENLARMVRQILSDELPGLKNNSLLYDLVLYTLIEKMNTVQKVENVLSYIKGNRVKEVEEVSIKNGEIRIRCSV